VSTDRAPVALLLSPHPDDELLGCPAHLFALRDSGWRIVDFALSLGREERQVERAAELAEACSRAGFELVVAPPGRRIADDGRVATDVDLLDEVLGLCGELAPALLVAPSPHDGHPAHELAGRIAVAAVRAAGASRLWLWGLWADLPFPTSLCLVTDERLAEIERALDAHAGELARNDYRRLVRARAAAAAVVLPERAFGFGLAGLQPGALVEGVCEVLADPSGPLRLAEPEIALPGEPPLGGRAGPLALDAWLDSPSPHDLIGGAARP